MKKCPACGSFCNNKDRYCLSRRRGEQQCGYDFVAVKLDPVTTDVPLPRWCQPTPVRTARYKLDALDEAAARAINKRMRLQERRT